MLSLTLLIVSWTKLYNVAPISTLSYKVHETFCHDMLPYFYEDRLALKSFTCDDIKFFIRQSFDQWQYNTPIIFNEVTDNNRSNIVISITDNAKENILASASIQYNSLNISVDDSFCWYTDRSFCHFMKQNHIVLIFILSLLFASGVFSAMYILVRPYNTIDPLIRILVWTFVFSIPLIYWTCIIPCMECYDFVTTMTHEIGHLLGLGHVDDDILTKKCGCGSKKKTCETIPSQSIMFKLYDHHMTCLSQDDIDAVLTLHNYECTQHIICYNDKEYVGIHRFSISLVYSFIFSWCIVCVRNTICRIRKTKIRKKKFKTYITGIQK